jgi:tRNA(Arg) A34 adenosine deaminase TadA
MTGEDATITDQDRELLRAAIAASWRAREHGNHPFGAVLADSAGRIVLEAENAVTTENDCTAHAETVLARAAWRQVGAATLANHTLYTSCEPCAMCSGAIYWSGIGRVVYAMTEAQLAELTGDHLENRTMSLASATVLNSGQRRIAVAGPAIAEEARAAHEGFWS